MSELEAADLPLGETSPEMALCISELLPIINDKNRQHELITLIRSNISSLPLTENSPLKDGEIFSATEEEFLNFHIKGYPENCQYPIDFFHLFVWHSLKMDPELILNSINSVLQDDLYQTRCINYFFQWLYYFPEDFTTNSIYKLAVQLSKIVKTVLPTTKALLFSVAEGIFNKKIKLPIHEKEMAMTPINIPIKRSLLDYDPFTISNHLAYINREHISNITRGVFLKGFRISYRDLSYTKWFNQVAADISECFRQHPNDAAQWIKYWLHVIDSSLHLKDYSALYLVLGGLSGLPFFDTIAQDFDIDDDEKRVLDTLNHYSNPYEGYSDLQKMIYGFDEKTYLPSIAVMLTNLHRKWDQHPDMLSSIENNQPKILNLSKMLSVLGDVEEIVQNWGSEMNLEVDPNFAARMKNAFSSLL